jgi:metal-dependent amidase/aminoacylase/carboxypeptidase family protein
MPIVNRVADLHDEIKAWRQDIHAHPELMFDVHRTAGVVAEKLKAFGCDEVVTGIGRTGVVGVIRGKKGSATRTIGLRADMDCPTSRRTPARCTPAATTATPRCFWAPPSISPRRATSTAPRW